MSSFLVADDSSAIQKVIKIAFSSFNADIVECYNLEQAHHELEQKNFAAVIVDVNLPGVRNHADFSALKQRAGKAGIILLAGSYDDFNETQFRQLGFDNIIRKPFDASGIIKAVKSLVADGALPKKQNLETPASVNSSRMGELSNAFAYQLDSSSDPTKTLIDIGRKGKKAFEILTTENSSAPTTRAASEPETPGLPAPPPLKPTAERLSSALAKDGAGIKLSDIKLDSREYIIEQEGSDDDLPIAVGIRDSGAEAILPRDKVERRLASAYTQANPSPSPARESFSALPGELELKERVQALLSQELRALVAKEVKAYCAQNFNDLAKQVLLEEIRRLTAERLRHLGDH